ncbi:futalosine hydrolase [Streptomyces sp. G-5]|uniref:futalosine hydrolase n=1 Tax=Streptomyces sp. G-5 TaxID=2977231 RepID=UPI0021D3AE63|nr:futalosine hydrolase [Streptomyces sp. G-5]MCU4747380.1 futalosine hydrolase [Streptomyces sp. G-5]
MGRVLVVTAVAAERDAVLRAVGSGGAGDADAGGAGAGAVRYAVLAAGAGPAAAAAATAFTLAGSGPAPYDLVISAGIGGGIAPHAGIGDTVVASALVAADLGAQTPGEGPDGFTDLGTLGFGTAAYPADPGLSPAVAAALGAVHAPVLTVSTATGTAARAAELVRRHPGAAAEAMEGFGVAEAAARAGVPVLEIRTVSNAVGPRDRAAWRIGEALTALTEAFARMVPVLEDGLGAPTAERSTAP